MDTPNNDKKHWIILLSICLMVGSSVGILVNGIGVFYHPMAVDLGVLQGSLSLHGTFRSLSSGFTALIVYRSINRFGWKQAISFGAITGALGTLLLATANNLHMIYLFGIIQGIGSAFISLIPMNIIINNWFYDKKAVAIGLATATSGIIGSLAAPFFARLIELFDWRFAFIVQGVIALALVLPAMLIPYTLDPRDEGLLPLGYKEDEVDKRPVFRTKDTKFSPMTLPFIILITVGLLNTMIVFISPHIPSFGQSIGLNPGLASLMLSALMIGNLLSKIVFGFVSERLGTIKTSLIAIFLSCISLVLFIFSQSIPVLILASTLFGSIFSVTSVALPLLTNEFYDPVTANKVFAILSFVATLGSAAAIAIVGYIYDFTGSYTPAFIAALVFNLINTVMLLLAHKKKLRKF